MNTHNLFTIFLPPQFSNPQDLTEFLKALKGSLFPFIETDASSHSHTITLYVIYRLLHKMCVCALFNATKIIVNIPLCQEYIKCGEREQH